MVVHAVLPESINTNVLQQPETRQDITSSVPLIFQQASEAYRYPMSPSLNSIGQQILNLPSEELNQLATSSSFASLPHINAAVSNASATTALLAAVNATNPMLFNALMNIQQNSIPAALPPNIHAFATLLPYLQQMQNSPQSEYVMQQLFALQQMAALQQIAAASQAVVQQQQQPPQHWLSPPPSAASVSENASSPILSTSDESLSVMSESSHVSPRPRGDVVSPDGDGSVMISEDEYMIERLIEARKGLSEKESIAVAVLAGMAGYQR